MKDKKILHSWKEIADYLGREIRTCYKWEKDHQLPVHRIDSLSSRSRVFAYASELDTWLGERENRNHIKKGTSWKKSIFYLFGLFVTAVAVIFLIQYLSPNKVPSFSKKRPSLVIIPFEYFNSSEYEKYFAEGLTNQITNLLSLQEKFNVFPPSVISKHKGSELDLNQIGEEFGAKYVLKGTLEKNEGKISLDLKLYKAKKNKIIWETTINDSDEDILLFGNKIFLELKDRFMLMRRTVSDFRANIQLLKPTCKIKKNYL